MKIAKIILAIAFAAICASAECLYTGFNATIGAEFYTADTPNGDYEIFDQAGPAFGLGFDVGFPISLQNGGNLALGIGWDGWFQSVESGNRDDTALLMILGPAINTKFNRFVAGIRLGTSFVIETEDGEGGTMGFGMKGYFGNEFTTNWSLIFTAHYTSTEHNDYTDIDVSGFGAGISYNAF